MESYTILLENKYRKQDIANQCRRHAIFHVVVPETLYT